ncbi:hypothetical protein Gotri_016170 [Gossypium trilobum]|uniref:Uncharacterized protein n=1 Tax=Gossypium trilobum TaxID=34281 RepID=A0A7J9E2N0_9ROSI|nr:hypothetical protein [Gossypium trilobum]
MRNLLPYTQKDRATGKDAQTATHILKNYMLRMLLIKES